ncbi:MAG TPA: hypothetical protein DCS09_08875 [Porphyromonadaceae bacterium]|nr:hypothetical protein [Porphyromonadaceae bacterium]
MTQKEIAKKIGISASQLSLALSGQRSLNYRKAKKIAELIAGKEINPAPAEIYLWMPDGSAGDRKLAVKKITSKR